MCRPSIFIYYSILISYLICSDWRFVRFEAVYLIQCVKIKSKNKKTKIPLKVIYIHKKRKKKKRITDTETVTIMMLYVNWVYDVVCI